MSSNQVFIIDSPAFRFVEMRFSDNGGTTAQTRDQLHAGQHKMANMPHMHVAGLWVPGATHT